MCWPAYDYDELINRDKASPDIFLLRDESLEETDNPPDPDVLAQENRRPSTRFARDDPESGSTATGRGQRRGVEHLDAALEYSARSRRI